ncbi:MAG: phage portal protein, partial [Chloroflexota bacterium]|nr:phage portal protein [Chloroflexota bacterium]
MAHDQQDALAWAVGAFRDVDRAARYALAARYLDGDQDLAFATSKYESAFGSLFKAFSYNRCLSVVDAHTDRLQVEGFTAADETVAERAMEIWDRNRMPIRFNEFVGEGLSVGDSYLLVWPDDDGRATIWPQAASNVRVHYSDERPGLVTSATKTWTLHDGRMRLNVYTSNLIERFVTKTKALSGIPASTRSFEPYEDDAPAITIHPWGIPVAHYANNGRTGAYGRSELRDVIPLQDAINKTMTDMLVAMELMAYPQRVILGMDNADPETGDAIQKFVAGMSRILT